MFGSYKSRPSWLSRDRYSSVSSLDSDDVEKPLHESELSTRQRPQYPLGDRLKNIILVFLTVAVTVLAVSHLQLPGRRRHAVQRLRTDSSYVDGVEEPVYTPFKYITPYAPESLDDLSQVDDVWEALRPAFGIVSVDHDWAAQQGLQRADSLESDPDKGVYTITAYHDLHCLILLRRTMFQLARKEPLSAPLGHSMHCFDAMRQSIVCQADERLLNLHKGLTDGEGQVRKCRSWDALREFAAENTACYDDGHEGIKFENRTGCAERAAFGDGMILN